MRDLRNHGRERLTVTPLGRLGSRVATHAKPEPDASALLARWQQLPHVEGRAIERDLDEAIDSTL